MMEISGASAALGQINSAQSGSLSQAVGISVLKMANETSAQLAQATIQMMEQSVQPNLGRNINIRA